MFQIQLMITFQVLLSSRITGAFCYFWQFTFFDGDESGLSDNGTHQTSLQIIDLNQPSLTTNLLVLSMLMVLISQVDIR